MQPKYTLFRAAYRQFIYRGFDVRKTDTGLLVTYDFDIPDLVSFAPTWVFPCDSIDTDTPTLRALLFNLGMAELVSYWKCCCPPEIVVECGSLTEEQIAFWRKLFFNGLGEFFYKNGIDATIDDFATIVSRGETYTADGEALDGALVPVGGGKDSAVTLELIKRINLRVTPYSINPHRACIATVTASGADTASLYAPRRTIDKQLLELNAQGFLNGHTPFSAIVAFSSLVAAYIRKCKYIVLSNEASANEATVGNVNHQYSKSEEFERDFREYTAKFLPFGAEYFSLLRRFSEIYIAKRFSSYPQYFDVFLSCNLGSKTDSWCGKCPKCLFVFLMLAPFVGRSTAAKIFGKDLLDDETLIETLHKLIGVLPEKPFECVGSRDEARLACNMLATASDTSVLIEEYKKQRFLSPSVLPLTPLREGGFIPDLFLPCLDEDTQMSRIDRIKAEFNGKRVAILGFGREGQSTYRLYRRFFPTAELVVADRRSIVLPDGEDDYVTCVSGASYIDACKTADMVMISPGIPQFSLPEWIIGKLCSQTRLFLKHYGDITVGITGTKGKSTCSSLIAAELDNSILVGNIGKPVFDYLDDISDTTAVVYELSCHQLEGCRYSPSIAVITNLFEEHLDHYGTLDRYYGAKKNIYLHRAEVLFIHDENNAELNNTELPSHTLTYCADYSSSADITLRESEGSVTLISPEGSITAELEKLKLCGKHNLGYAAIAFFIAKRRGITDGIFLQRLYAFEGLSHRLQYVATLDGMKYYDDSISTIPQATIAGIEALHDVSTVILGGMERDIDLSPLSDYLAEHPVHTMILLPQTGARLGAELSRYGITDGVYYADDVEDAVRIAASRALPNTSCLFSPAAASYHLYKNFEERGAHFADCVRALHNKSAE